MHVQTELKKCGVLSERLGASVWLKMENTQISGSFKYRGISLLCKKSVSEGCQKFVCSSGGNAGLAATYAARELATPISVYVPETTPIIMREKLKECGATVHVHGKVWDEANENALEAAKEPGVSIIHPFDHPTIWEGHSTIITEVSTQLHPVVPDLIIASVGGGGLMNGILQGMDKVGWGRVPFVAMETRGADSLNACVREGKWVSLDKITSVAKCLGALRVCHSTYERLSQTNVHSCVTTDTEAIKGCLFMADHHGVLIPPACGAAIAGVTDPSIISGLQSNGLLLPGQLNNILIIVCGGSGVTEVLIEEWRRKIATGTTTL